MKPRLLWMFAALLAASAHADMYQWVDKDGRTVYSDVPPPDAKAVDKRRLGDRVSEARELPYATQQAMMKYPVTLYTNDCGEPCSQAKALLAKRGVPHVLKNPEISSEEAAELKGLVGSLEVPTLLVGRDKPVKGFEEGAWSALLDSAGYPKSNPGVKGELAKAATKPKAQAETSPQPAKTVAPTERGPYAEVEAGGQAKSHAK